MYNFIDFTGKRIIVAGASSGIGKQTAVTLSRLGAEVILLARREERLREVIHELEGDNHTYYCIDLSQTEKIEPLIRQIVEKKGKVDGLVYSAGISIDTPLHLMKKEKTAKVFDTNLFGYMECVKAVCKKGVYNGGLRIVGVSSVASLIGNNSHESYAASKAGMDAFMRCVASEQAKKGISINNVAPGWVKTEMVDKFLADTGAESINKLDRQYKGLLASQDVANAICFLLSPAAKMITGVTLPVDGGTLSN